VSRYSLLPAQEAAERALEAPAGHQRIAIVQEMSEIELRFANNTVSTNGRRRDRRTTVVTFRPVPGGTAVGVASSAAGTAAELAQLVEESEAGAAGAAPAEDAFPLVEDGPPGGEPWEEPPRQAEVGSVHHVAGALGPAFGRAQAEGEVLAGFAAQHLHTTYLATSTGLRLRHTQPAAKLEMVGRSPQGDRSAWVGLGGRDLADLDVAGAEDTLRGRLAWAERRLDLPAGRYETLLPPAAVADLMIFMSAAMGGRDAEDGRSVFSAPGGRTRVGEALSPTPFTLRGDPAEPGLACAPFLVASVSGRDVSVFDNGLPLEPTSWLSEGRLQRLRYHRAGAARSGVPPAPPIGNLLLEVPGATSSLEEMVRSTQRALLLTCLWYIRPVDPATLLLTGLTRDGVYLVEDGEVVGAVNNFRFNESPVDLLARASEAGRTQACLAREANEWLSRTAMPALRIPDFNMSTVSPAS